jgi:hypothetical protein
VRPAWDTQVSQGNQLSAQINAHWQDKSRISKGNPQGAVCIRNQDSLRGDSCSWRTLGTYKQWLEKKPCWQRLMGSLSLSIEA